jgi:hypothetical protein
MAGCIGLLGIVIHILLCETLAADLLIISHLISLETFGAAWTGLFEIDCILIA